MREEVARRWLYCAFSHPNILRPEQELSVQVGFFYEVHVSYGDVSFFSSTEPNEGKVLKKLTANSASSNLGKWQERLRQTKWILAHAVEVNVIKLKLRFCSYSVAENYSSIVAHCLFHFLIVCMQFSIKSNYVYLSHTQSYTVQHVVKFDKQIVKIE